MKMVTKQTQNNLEGLSKGEDGSNSIYRFDLSKPIHSRNLKQLFERITIDESKEVYSVKFW